MRNKARRARRGWGTCSSRRLLCKGAEEDEEEEQRPGHAPSPSKQRPLPLLAAATATAAGAGASSTTRWSGVGGGREEWSGRTPRPASECAVSVCVPRASFAQPEGGWGDFLYFDIFFFCLKNPHKNITSPSHLHHIETLNVANNPCMEY